MDADLLRRLGEARDLLADEPLGLARVAERACLSPFHFHRQFVRVYGQTPHVFATTRRLERAKHLLLTTDLPVQEIVLAVGYESPGSFGTRFSREFGISPAEFRRDARRFWHIGGIRSHRFVPFCFVQNGKIREALRQPNGLA